LIGDLVDLAAQPLHRAERGSGEQPGTRPGEQHQRDPTGNQVLADLLLGLLGGPECAADHDHPGAVAAGHGNRQQPHRLVVEAPVDEARPLTCRRPLAGRPGCPLAGTRLWGVP
jgi:hypothetical protein